MSKFSIYEPNCSSISIVCCGAPFRVLFFTQQKRRSLSRHRACRSGRVAPDGYRDLYCSNSMQLKNTMLIANNETTYYSSEASRS